MENIDDFESTVYSFVRKHTGNSRKTRSTEDFHPEEYLDNPEKLLVDIKERGVTEEFYTILNKILVDNSSQIISEGSIMNNQLLAHDELVSSLILIPVSGGASAAVGVSASIAYHVACYKDADQDYLDCIK